MKGFRSITTRLVFWVLGSIGLVYCANLIYQNHLARETVLAMTRERADSITGATIYEIEAVLQSLENGAETLASVMETVHPPLDKLREVIPAFVRNNPRIYGSTIAFEPGVYDPSIGEYSPYYYREGDELSYADLADPDYRYLEWDWYRRPAALGRPVWTEPYYDEGGGNIIMSIYSVPFFREVEGERRVAGVVTADISLEWLHELVGRIRPVDAGYAVILSREGKFVTHPNPDLIMKETDFILSRSADAEKLRLLIADMRAGGSGFASFRSLVTGRPSWMAYAPFRTAGWSMGVIFPQDELMKDVDRLNRAQLLMGLLGLVLLVVMIVAVSRRITKPLRALAATTEKVAAGDLDFEVPHVRGRDEIGMLAESFHTMRDSLKAYIRDLKETTAAKERLEAELQIARQIQMAMLPQANYSGGEDGAWEVSAALEPAKAVGGDLYDYFLLDEGRLCFLVGDVSDKGVPAALFMARTNTLIKTVSDKADPPDVILSKVNRELCRDNDACMFVTLFCGILDIASGRLDCASGGHDPPLHISPGRGSHFLDLESGPALGLYEEAEYETSTVRLEPGDTLFLYTDGVTEAFDHHGKAFSEERLLAAVSKHAGARAVEITRTVLTAVQDFAAQAEQSDDITVFALQYRAATPAETAGS